ncbi:hypothetical protein AVEN_211217-1 [Araneus ventricosus]|uniref:Uncharacterized protein n=1 Tax=Araneus ventricosus TaxID=182803 RepID=A0A4Y2M0N2_ARAVE|nr:hypothetical protein AVEN_211217-1 [Araneus ventricosus]
MVHSERNFYGLIDHPWLNHDQRLNWNLYEQVNADRNDRLDVYPNRREARLARRLRVILKITNNREIEIPCQKSNPLGYRFGYAIRIFVAEPSFNR